MHDHGVLVGQLDLLELIAEEGRRPPLDTRPQVLLDGELDILAGQLAPVLMKHDPPPEVEGPGLIVVRGFPVGCESRPILEGLWVPGDQRIVDAVPQGFFRLAGAPGERRFDPPLADRDDKPVTLGGWLGWGRFSLLCGHRCSLPRSKKGADQAAQQKQQRELEYRGDTLNTEASGHGPLSSRDTCGVEPHWLLSRRG